jgi:hypothetical protein
MRLLLALGVLLGLAATSQAHPLDMGYLRVEATDDHVAVTLDLDRGAAAQLIGLTELDSSVRTRKRIAAATYLATRIVSDRGECLWSTPTAQLAGRTLSLRDRAECPAGARALRWELPMLGQLPTTFQLLVKARGFGGEVVTMLDRETPAFELHRGDDDAITFGGFVWSGVEHIGAAPSEWRGAGGLVLPDGIDHILFLLALLIGGGTLMRLVGIATGFTLGHSITLALAALDIVRLPGWLIEPLIALTIALAALEAMTGRFERHRRKIATGFGLIHGFGFAAALTELELSTGDMVTALFGYNLGVELGQVAIVLVTAPLVMLLYRSPRWCRAIVPAIGATIFVAGMYWFLERAFT